MRLKLETILVPAQNGENRISALAFSPNGMRFAVATADRQILLFDEHHVQRDKFTTKPSKSSAGRRSYLVRALAFSPDSTKLAVGQTDSIVYVYRLGDKWGDRKAICHKFPQTKPVISAVWPVAGVIVCGLMDGKLRGLNVNTNKSQAFFGSDSMVVALCVGPNGTGVLSGHVDGTIYRHYLEEEKDTGEPRGKVAKHSVAPYALAWAHGHVFAAGSDRRVTIYGAPGSGGLARVVKQFDYSRDGDEKEFTVACCSSSGQSVVVGSFDHIRLYLWDPPQNAWTEGPLQRIEHLYTVTALAWRHDGARLACGSLCGAVLLFESVLRRTRVRDILELMYVGPSQMVVRRIDGTAGSVVLKSSLGLELKDVKVMGRDRYIVARTTKSLLLADIWSGLSSEIPWPDSGKKERFYFENPTVCLIFNAGELTLVEYGRTEPLVSVRTEHANPHLVSVRLDERPEAGRWLAYLLDARTVCINKLDTSGTQLVAHDAAIDWLELGETGERLLFRDHRQRLLLWESKSSLKTCLITDAAFAQWIEATDAAVAQVGGSLAVWYNLDEPERPGALLPVRGDVYDVVRENGRTEALARDQSGKTVRILLDEALLEFSAATRDADHGRAVQFLEQMEGQANRAEAAAMWRTLLALALDSADLPLAERCAAALGDVARAWYLRETAQLPEHDRKARLALLTGDSTTAEAVYIERGEPETAIDMYKSMHRWPDALRLAERKVPHMLEPLRDEFLQWLARTGQHGRVAELLETRGDYERAVAAYLRGGRPARAASLLIARPSMLSDESLVGAALDKLERAGLMESAAELHERTGRPDKALDCYKRGGAWAHAVQVARTHNPGLVVALEEQWADSLVATGHHDAAISHYIEAGKTKKALDAAVAARQWTKAAHILHAMDGDSEALEKHLDPLAKHFVQVKDWVAAEKLYERAGKPERAVEALLAAGQCERALSFGRRVMDEQKLSEICLEHARVLDEEGRTRDAERLYVEAGEADAAIAMYKKREQYDSMVRLVERHHPDLLAATHLHLGQQLESRGRSRAAEAHYVSAGEWRAALAMYRATGAWEEAHRVARAHGGPAAAAHLAFAWAQALSSPEAAARLLQRLGLLEAGVEHACDSAHWDLALGLCRVALPAKLPDVHCRRAMALEDEGRFAEAEEEFVRGGRPLEAIHMYTHGAAWPEALRVAETHAPESVHDVLAAQATAALAEGRVTEFEALMLRARRPGAVIDAHCEAGRWQDAIRVCRDHAPDRLLTLQAEYERSDAGRASVAAATSASTSSASVSELAELADECVAAGQHARAVELLVAAAERTPDESTSRRALLRAADLAHRFLADRQVAEAARRLGPRLVDFGEHAAAAQLYLGADMNRAAVEALVAAEDWTRARRVARELEPALERLVDQRQREKLREQGDAERLADIDLVDALDLLAEQGQWVRCLERARSHSAPLLHKYVSQRAAQLLHSNRPLEALALYVEHGAPAVSHNYNVYARIALDLFAAPGLSDDYNTWSRLRKMLLEVVRGLEALSGQDDATEQFRTLLTVAHMHATRAASRGVPSLSALPARLSLALLRHTDGIVPADKAYYEAGTEVRNQGRLAEAFVLLNHYLDICEAIEEGDARLVDHTDLQNTDFPSSIPLPSSLYLADDPRTHDEVREWLLAVGMDQRVHQELPLDDRGLFESSLAPGDVACLVTGYPVNSKQPVTFQKSSMTANRDAWSKLLMAAKLVPQSDVPDVVGFVEQWCGPANSMIT